MSVTHRAVPEEFRGVWVRTLRQTDTDTDTDTDALPAADNNSWVRWMQTSSWHADLRVPDLALRARSTASR